MSWSDDTRCLFCDGRLPLYRKITHGQFCSNAHRKSYWDDQERLAVERLSQTHNSLQAFRLAVAAEPVPADEPEVVYPQITPGENGDPGVGTLVPQAWISPVAVLPGMLAGDPLEYEMFASPQRPVAAAIIEVRVLPTAQPVRGWADFAASQWDGQLSKRDLTPFTRDLGPERPKLSLVPMDVVPEIVISAEAPATADRVEIPLFVRDWKKASSTNDPLGSTLAPVTKLELQVRPGTSDAMLLLLDALSPCPDRLFSLPYVTGSAGGPWPVQKSDQEQTPIEPHTSVLRGEINPEFTAVTLVPEDAGLVGLPVEYAALSQNVFQIEPRNLDARMDTPASLFVAVPVAKELNLPLAASQLTFPVSDEREILGANLDPFAAETRAVGLPAFRASITALAGVPDAFTSLVELGYGKDKPLCGDATAALRPIHFFPQHPAPAPLIPQSRLLPVVFKPEPITPVEPAPIGESVASPLVPPIARARQHPQLWSHAADFWQHAPRDLKLLAFAIPVLLALAFHPSLPKVSLAAPRTTSVDTSEFRKVINDQWSNVRQSVVERAAIALDEDFRQGLDDWASPGGSTTSWSFDQTGFVRPGPLALYRPTVGLTDYQLQFLGLIDKKAISWVVRAADFDNYYVIKMTVLKPGPIPTLGIIRYAVIHGKAQDRVDTPVQISARPDMLYRILVDVHGDTFTLGVQGQVIDSWTEPRLSRGGVGFFSARGEESRVRWVQVTHQYDMLGRLCAYLAPYNIPSTNGSWQP